MCNPCVSKAALLLKSRTEKAQQPVFHATGLFPSRHPAKRWAGLRRLPTLARVCLIYERDAVIIRQTFLRKHFQRLSQRRGIARGEGRAAGALPVSGMSPFAQPHLAGYAARSSARGWGTGLGGPGVFSPKTHARSSSITSLPVCVGICPADRRKLGSRARGRFVSAFTAVPRELGKPLTLFLLSHLRNMCHGLARLM